MAVVRSCWVNGFRKRGKRSEVKCPRQIWDTEIKNTVFIVWTDFLTAKSGNFVTPEGGREIRNDPDFIRKYVAESLKKLQTDQVDLLYQ